MCFTTGRCNISGKYHAKLESLQKELLQRTNGTVEYNDIADEIYRLREEKQNVLPEYS
ncbi:MAG: hypothetical protein VB134_01595 [[Clostridium] symbiosum]|uniref:Uncharacterized protein n=1 Tax=Anaerotignum propionicum DSM 1682 TaxID=991789 RepID=A0A0X1U8Q0_ANAPI|nr:hypothetical protein [Anaerotignum propionicum]AMJ41306.1 hypothetical protein CPRO_17180 [Anaerotignum propionicum DSM 1682]MEA4841853.1 hypothetical protein [[Clostridium] symbiosum]SHE96654.1 hypothetical protein SAMN02745151_02344 [[Clostridium] propionicum DSM 1682] [Anaerotignum propionicum DSM 1682]